MVRRSFRSIRKSQHQSNCCDRFQPVVEYLSVNMVGSQRYLTVTFCAWLLMSAKISGDDGFGQSSLVGAANVEVTKETLHSSGSVNTSGIIQARDSEQSENGTPLGCPCDLNQCKRFCCPWGYSYSLEAKNCVEDALTPRARSVEGSIQNYHVLSEVFLGWNGGYKCCDVHISNYLNGSICRINLSEYPHFEDYCLYRVLNTNSYGILQCLPLTYEGEWDAESRLYNLLMPVCLGSAALIALATFIVYSLVPKLKNFQGQIVRSYLASYSSCMVFATTSNLSKSQYGTSFAVQGLILIYSGFACLLWLNVMSFDIWRTVREFRFSQPVNAEDRKSATFIQYSFYAWGVPGLFIAIGWGLCGWPLLIVGSPVLLRLSLPVLGIFICNTYFYTSTALKIKQIKKETAQIIDGASKHHQKNEQWFNLYLKLFITMGCPMILWAIGMAFNTTISFMIVFSVEPLQAICVFYMFVWKDDVKRSIREQFAGMLRRLGCCRRSDSTSDMQNRNEEL